MTRSPEEAPDRSEIVTIGFESGRPVRLDGQRLTAAALVERLNAIAGLHGVGRVDLVENRFVGIKSRGVYETPGGTVLIEALRSLQSLTLDRETSRFLQQVSLRYADLVYTGGWFTPLRESLDAFVNAALATTSGEVEVRLFKGSAAACARRSKHSLYDAALGSFSMDGYRPSDAEGFINLTALPLAVRALKFGPAAPIRGSARDAAIRAEGAKGSTASRSGAGSAKRPASPRRVAGASR
jgi:argininosuccinate synthase